ncbi:heterokaryon incompatibility protein-domain-containing protein [Xylariaceae sp. FL0255]|nr:heterokaryon incompatibility protein-domain-containing protein [Xylariaceae sp. FL0255]
MEPFTYTQLQKDEIRLLSSTMDGEKVAWSLNHVHIRQNHSLLEYDALSYTWGNLTDEKFQLACGGKAIWIHQNLYEALPHLARRRCARPIWIDAVCINQDDEVEKIAQVRQMHRIYRQASHVWVWLGCSTPYTVEAISVLPRIVTTCSDLRAQPMAPGVYHSLASRGLPAHRSSPIWRAIQEIINHPWFCRLWIVQEAALAKSISFLVGPNEVDWQFLNDVVDHAYKLAELRDSDGHKLDVRPSLQNQRVFTMRRLISEFRDVAAEVGVKCAIPQLLLRAVHKTTGSHFCSDARDRVWGIHGFLDGYQPTDLKLDETLSINELYTQLCRYIFTNVSPGHSDYWLRRIWWKLLDRATWADKRPGLPSWCPDLHQHVENEGTMSTMNLEPLECFGGNKYEASNTGDCAKPGKNLHELVLGGVIFDVAECLHPKSPVDEKNFFSIKGKGIWKAFLQVQSWEEALAVSILGPQAAGLRAAMTSDMPVDPTISANIDKYWRTIIGDAYIIDGFTITYQTYVDFKTALDGIEKLIAKYGGIDGINCLKLSQADEHDLKTLEMIDPGSGFYYYTVMIGQFLQSRRLFTTACGRFGFSSPAVVPGDLVCIFDYAWTPHIIRQEEGSSSYHLVSEAYVNGMMRGEVQNLGLERTDIVIV